MKSVILLSGGLDSATCLYYALSKKHHCFCLIFNYGQKHKKEIKKAVAIAKTARVEYKIVNLALPWGLGALADKSKTIPAFKENRKHLPSTYVPGRNTLFLSFALSFAESIKANNIFIGANSIDFSGYPDCRPQFINAYNNLLRCLNLKIKVLAPLLHLTKGQIIKLGLKLKVPYHLTWSCYRGLAAPCGKCDSCKLRAKGFREADLSDPALR
ncbi:MAG: 7-cyano-7-deazaguanine synthase QueC [Elusimicrobiota bacterium]|jgi:7-cyano-7-deazaguanine synthase|nr:7-cyano-7-deazaguanine synthase QueC [Elusimicrobiota bacterium]